MYAKIFTITLTALLVAAGIATAQPTTAESTTIPGAELNKLKSLFNPKKQPSSEDELREMAVSQMRQAIDYSQELENQYPGAKNIWQLRQQTFYAAEISNRFKPDSQMQALRLETAKKILDDPNAPGVLKVRMDSALLSAASQNANLGDGEQIDAKLKAFVARYTEEPARQSAIVEAVVLADANQRTELVNQWAGILEAKYSGDPQAIKSLMKIGRGPVFKARLEKLDGSVLNIPQDLAGKIVVVDFWATWCPPCRASIPGMKKIYDEYKGKGLEIVAISLDEDRSELQKYISEQKLPWIQAFSGKGWNDPTAQKYGVNSIPRVMLLSKNGKIVSDDAHDNLEELIIRQLENK